MTQQDIDNGYHTSNLIANGSFGLLAGVGTGAVGSLGRAGRLVTAYDTLGSGPDVGRGA